MPEELQDLIERINKLEKRLVLFEAHDHYLTGGSPLYLKNLANYGLQEASITLVGTEPASAANFDTFFVAEFDLEIIAASESLRVAGNDAGAVTLDIEKLTSGQASGAGVSVLSTTFNLKSTAETPVRVTATTTKVDRILKRGDRLSLKDTGTLTNLAHMTLSIFFLPL